MKLMIKDAIVMTLDDEDKWLEDCDIVIDKEKIVDIGQDLSPEYYAVEKIVNGKDKLVIPGLINAHLHSHDRFDKGRFDNLPLEVWMALYNPPLGTRHWTPRECYLRTLLNAIEMLKTGTTTVIDDVSHGIPLSEENVDAVFQAYQDIGMRALVSIYYNDRPFAKTIPYLEDILPANLKAELAQMPGITPDDMIDIWRKFGERYRDRIRFVLSPAAPQRCYDEFLKKTWRLSNELDLPVIIHVLETKVQAITGQIFYKKSIIEHMNSLGILTPRTNLIHSVWVSDTDIELISEAGASVIHNPVSNLKLGSGIAPIRKFLDAGINVALGTDNNNANDSINLFEVIKLSALLHKVVDSNYDKWVGAKQVVRMATRGGAQCAGIHNEVGYLDIGMKADMVMFNLNKLSFFPRNNLLHQLVFCEQGESVDTVIVDGKIVVEKGAMTTVNESKIINELIGCAEEIQGKIRQASARGPELEPYCREAFFKCVQKDIGFSAYSGN